MLILYMNNLYTYQISYKLYETNILIPYFLFKY